MSQSSNTHWTLNKEPHCGLIPAFKCADFYLISCVYACVCVCVCEVDALLAVESFLLTQPGIINHTSPREALQSVQHMTPSVRTDTWLKWGKTPPKKDLWQEEINRKNYQGGESFSQDGQMCSICAQNKSTITSQIVKKSEEDPFRDLINIASSPPQRNEAFSLLSSVRKQIVKPSCGLLPSSLCSIWVKHSRYRQLAN